MDSQTAQLALFLQEELHISADRTSQVLAQCPNPRRLPVILWQKKLMTLAQLDGVLAWLEGYVGRIAYWPNLRLNPWHAKGRDGSLSILRFIALRPES